MRLLVEEGGEQLTQLGRVVSTARLEVEAAGADEAHERQHPRIRWPQPRDPGSLEGHHLVQHAAEDVEYIRIRPRMGLASHRERARTKSSDCAVGMPKGTKRKATEAVAAPNPLRDRGAIETAARSVAAELKQRKDHPITAMAFCIKVLHVLGLRDYAIGQSERIFISSIRKQALGDADSRLVAKPDSAAPVDLPSFDDIGASLVEGLPAIIAASSPTDLRLRIAASFDPAALSTNSHVHLRSLLSAREVGEIAFGMVTKHGRSDVQGHRVTLLRESSGTGCNGGYCDVTLRQNSLLTIFADALTAVIRERMGCDKLGGKVLATRYGPGGVNWAHQDQSEGAYQAYLLLSRPEVDFTGGELYIADPAGAKAKAPGGRHGVAWEASGDCVIFAANDKAACARSWYHGFRQVRPGSAGEERCHLLVVGLLE